MGEAKDFLKSRSPVNLGMVAANILVFIVMEILGDTQNVSFMMTHGAAYTPYILWEGKYYLLITSMFLHFGVEHLFNNMLVLVFLGDILEKEVGKIRYLIIYLGGGVLGNCVSMITDMRTGSFAVSAGASGAIFAVIGALLWLVIRNRGHLGDLSGRGLFLMALLSVFQGYTSSGVDNSAHIGGLVTGFLLCLLLNIRLRGKKE